ncbi:MAG: N-acetyltransferase [Acidobacteriota bacterium]|nr:N-acetyltransferase [Acidobacteriota bacterium]
MWRIFQAVVAGGDTYVFAPDTGPDVAVEYFMGSGISSWVAEIPSSPGGFHLRQGFGGLVGEASSVVGMYKLIPNHRDLGSHVANASFMVDPAAQGKGVGRAMGEHCLAQARQAGYEAMQFNFVVSTNTAGVELWKKLGFSIVGTLPKAFNHAQLGLVDAFVMHRFL